MAVDSTPEMILYDIMWYDMVRYMVWYGMVRYDKIWYGTVWYDMTWYMVWYDMIWYGMVRYDMIWHDIWYMIWYIFNRDWVDTRWQQYSTHLHTNKLYTEYGEGNTHNNQKIKHPNNEKINQCDTKLNNVANIKTKASYLIILSLVKTCLLNAVN
jgi:hypothetical protein